MFFIRKDYGPDVAGVCVVLMCQRASLNLKQRVRFYKKDRQLYLDVMFDLAEMEGLDPDGRMLAVGQNVAAVTRATLAKYAFEQFDAERFLADFEQWWKRHTEEL